MAVGWHVGGSRHAARSGQATVELALSLGILMLLLVASLDFGRAFYDYVAIVNAAREGARAGIMANSPSAIEPAVRQELQGSNIDQSRLMVQHSWGGSGQPLVVTVRYRFNALSRAILPFVQLTLQSSTTMMIP